MKNSWNFSMSAPRSENTTAARTGNLLNATLLPNLKRIAMSVKSVLWYAWLSLVVVTLWIATYFKSKKSEEPQQPKDYVMTQKRFGSKAKAK